MIQSWTSNGDDGSRHTADDVRTLAIDVLAFAGFQKSYPFLSHRQKAELQDEAILSSYRDALAIILRNVLVIIVLPASFFNLPFLPKKWTQIGLAMSAFKKYMLDEVADEKRSISEGKPGSGTLVSNLVQASEQQDQDSKNNSTRMQTLKPLTISEILGNIFVFNFAGHDTTAISLSYALLLLVAHPEVQDWISEEINHYLASPSPDSRNYESTFPKLQRCLAVLFETLRLYNPIPGIPKHTSSNPQTLTLSPNNTLNIPPHTLVCPNLQALHTHPRYWGEDSLLWRPQRWITTSSSPPKDPSLETETLDTPKKGTFIAWSEGLQNCPGKRFAQVEFVAVIVALFRAHRAEVVPAYEGETQGEGRKRVMDAVADSELTLLLGMRDPGAVKVRWVRRG
ncbi:MAG: hypothetical protein LQ346_000775 [Caloplaca aetnensis]|nr:MAG: hypothetical protein LQ346_000775 [Caloplaca aetnensis]